MAQLADDLARERGAPISDSAAGEVAQTVVARDLATASAEARAVRLDRDRASRAEAEAARALG